MKGFDISLGSDQEHDDLTAMIYFDDELVATISQERGPGLLEIEFAERKSKEPWSFDLVEFGKTLDDARQNLLRLKKDRGPR